MTKSLQQRTPFVLMRDVVAGRALAHEIRSSLDISSIDLYLLQTSNSQRGGFKHGWDRQVQYTVKLDLKRLREWLEEHCPFRVEHFDAALVEEALLDGEEETIT